MKMMKFLITSLVFTGGVLLCSCDTGSFESDKKNKLTIDMSGEIVQGGQNFLMIDENDPKNTFARIDSVNVYGYGTNVVIPDSLKDCALKIIVSGRMRETETISGNISAMIQNYKDSTLYFGVMHSANYVQQPGPWFEFQDSLMIDQSVNTKNARNLRIWSGKGSGKGYFDTDNIRIEIIKE